MIHERRERVWQAKESRAFKKLSSQSYETPILFTSVTSACGRYKVRFYHEGGHECFVHMKEPFNWVVGSREQMPESVYTELCNAVKC